MKSFRISIAGCLAVTALIAMNLALLPMLRNLPRITFPPMIRLAFVGVLPTMDALVICSAIAIVHLARRREVGMPLVAFVFVGGAASLLFLASLYLAPDIINTYLDITAGFIDNPTTHTSMVHTIGMESRLAHAVIVVLLAWASVSALLMLPALLVGWACRGDRLKLAGRSETGIGGAGRSCPPAEAES